MALTRDEVRVWLLDFEAHPGEPERLRSALTRSELEEAEARFRTGARERFLCGRGMARTLLGAELGEEPRLVELRAGEGGKPVIAGGGLLRFNVSHSGTLVAVALALGREVGVDVERLREVDELAIARRELGTAHASALARYEGDERRAAFFAAWTGHEARLKCGAEDVEVVPLATVPGGYAGAVAAERPGFELRELDWARRPASS